MASRLIGGSALRARFENLRQVPRDFTSDWADETVRRIRQTKPPSDRPASSRFTTKANERRGGVYGAFWWIFVDRGTKAHDIVARRGKALRFEKGGQTIFARKVRHPRMKRRPFISAAAQGARDQFGIDLIIKAWNGRRLRGRHERFL